MSYRTSWMWSGCGAVLLALLLVGAVVGSARAEPPPELAKFAGSYTFAGTEAEGNAIIEKAIEDAVAQMNKVKALVIKKLIGGNKRFIKNVTIGLPSDKIRIQLDDMDVEAKPGETKTVEGRGGEAKLTLGFAKGAITQVLASDRGAFTIVYRLASGGQVLERDVTVTDKWLDKPVKYRLTYKRH